MSKLMANAFSGTLEMVGPAMCDFMVKELQEFCGGWQPLATAPRDGRSFILAWKHKVSDQGTYMHFVKFMADGTLVISWNHEEVLNNPAKSWWRPAPMLPKELQPW